MSLRLGLALALMLLSTGCKTVKAGEGIRPAFPEAPKELLSPVERPSFFPETSTNEINASA